MFHRNGSGSLVGQASPALFDGSPSLQTPKAIMAALAQRVVDLVSDSGPKGDAVRAQLMRATADEVGGPPRTGAKPNTSLQLDPRVLAVLVSVFEDDQAGAAWNTLAREAGPGVDGYLRETGDALDGVVWKPADEHARQLRERTAGHLLRLWGATEWSADDKQALPAGARKAVRIALLHPAAVNEPFAWTGLPVTQAAPGSSMAGGEIGCECVALTDRGEAVRFDAFLAPAEALGWEPVDANRAAQDFARAAEAGALILLSEPARLSS